MSAIVVVVVKEGTVCFVQHRFFKPKTAVEVLQECSLCEAHMPRFINEIYTHIYQDHILNIFLYSKYNI